ncbi:MAG: hypothetical protein QXU99_04365 [Candidatus Bathyarchaeia archaeon]
MSLSLVKFKILEELLLSDKPARATQIAKELGKKLPEVTMHLIWLSRNGYVCAPEKGSYTLTEKGKKVLGLPEINKETAKAILADVPPNKAFHFYTDIGKPLNCYANGLHDFCNKLNGISLDSIDFHLKRGDFESWFTALGDLELARKIAMLKEKNLHGEDLRDRLRDLVKNRCIFLATLT